MTSGPWGLDGFDVLMALLAAGTALLVVYLFLARRRLRVLERDQPDLATAAAPPAPALVALLQAALAGHEPGPAASAGEPAERPEP
jgi:hypothetical protein